MIMARWYGFWYGGPSYSPPQEEDLEEFSSLAEAKHKLIERYLYGYWQVSRFDFLRREPALVLTPCVTEDCEITLYRSRHGGDYPELRIFRGPRGGIRSERC
ncbi:hypothetical protein [Nonomuraea sp. NEAU-A123]|uniref:hypothetical protein n=1 Tax=Nonomuraea sp. NEAU-A123 TaxID=2839649 RepID=UPI001BE47A17|nr:hypothetical protein [Nonomuraea sp. NEAU-A123]MBT2233219.1 hypothetical protein [Nonomuraea sp. NEAU-A123]